VTRKIFSFLLALLILALCLNSAAGTEYEEEAEKMYSIADKMKAADYLSDDPMDMSEKTIEGTLEDVIYYRNVYAGESVTIKISVIPDDKELPQEYIFGVSYKDFDKVIFPADGNKKIRLYVAPDSRNHGRSIYSGNPYPYGWELKSVEIKDPVTKVDGIDNHYAITTDQWGEIQTYSIYMGNGNSAPSLA